MAYGLPPISVARGRHTAPLLAVALAILAPKAAASTDLIGLPRAQATVAGGSASVTGPLGRGPTLALRFSGALHEQISVGVLMASSRHRVGEAGLHLGHGAAEVEWRLDRGVIVPTVHLGAGALLVISGAGIVQTLPVIHAAGGADWWPGGPYRGLSLGAELRYVGRPAVSPTPLLGALTLRVGWGF
jgi:hypothetical protein